MTPAVLDITIALILLLSAGIAFYRGIIREIFTVLGVVASTAGAYFGGPLLIPVFSKWLDVHADGGEGAADAVSRAGGGDTLAAAAHKADLLLGVVSPALAAKIGAYGSVFIAIFLVMSLLSFFLSRGVHEAGLGFVDRIAGGAYGVARGFALVFLPFVLCYVLAGRDIDKFPAWAKNSVTVPAMREAYVYADEKFELGKMIEDRGGSIALKIEKINPAAGDMHPDERELKSELSREEEKLKSELSGEEQRQEPVMP